MARLSGPAFVRRASSSSSAMSCAQPGEHVDGAALDRPHVVELVEPVAAPPGSGPGARASRPRPPGRRSRRGSTPPARPTRSRRSAPWRRRRTRSRSPAASTRSACVRSGRRGRRPRCRPRSAPSPRPGPRRGTARRSRPARHPRPGGRTRCRRRARSPLRTTSSVRLPVPTAAAASSGERGGVLAHSVLLGLTGWWKRPEAGYRCGNMPVGVRDAPPSLLNHRIGVG